MALVEVEVEKLRGAGGAGVASFMLRLDVEVTGYLDGKKGIFKPRGRETRGGSSGFTGDPDLNDLVENSVDFKENLPDSEDPECVLVTGSLKLIGDLFVNPDLVGDPKSDLVGIPNDLVGESLDLVGDLWGERSGDLNGEFTSPFCCFSCRSSGFCNGSVDMCSFSSNFSDGSLKFSDGFSDLCCSDSGVELSQSNRFKGRFFCTFFSTTGSYFIGELAARFSDNISTLEAASIISRSSSLNSNESKLCELCGEEVS